jgi:mRNA interferase MazF
VQRGEVWWADLPVPKRSEPGYRRPVLIVSSDSYNRSAIATVVVAVVTSNLLLAEAPGNVKVTKRQSRLPKASVVNVSHLLTVSKNALLERAGTLPGSVMTKVSAGLVHVLGLSKIGGS